MLTVFELKQQILSLKEDLLNIEKILKIDEKIKRLQDIDNEINATTDWSDIKLYTSLSKEKTLLSNTINNFNKIKKD